MHASPSLAAQMRAARPSSSLVCLLLCLAAGAGCSDDDHDDPPPPPKPPKTRTELQPHEDLPGLILTITGLSGATGPSGSFRTGDRLSVTFTLTKGDGVEIAIEELDSNGIMVSGPTTNYQRVLERKTDLITASRLNSNGSYTYTFATAIPATYLPPLNDSASFGADHGELQGQPLLPGTYTLGMEVYKTYTVDELSFRDPASANSDFLLGGATTPEPREVVKHENCNQCHAEIRAHGEFRRDLGNCVLCHTAGAEDRNVATVEGGTPGVSIEFGVMIHRIHNAAHLPSVLGVATNPDGTRDYAATPKPYKMIGFQDSVIDFSEIAFPVWPNLNIALPRDHGYTQLTTGQRATEDTIRMGATDCSKCHGDPDGAGPVTAPAQGDNAYTKPQRRACGACHDDVDWSKPYVANLQTMGPQADDAECATCHPASGSVLAVRDGHLHPVVDPAFDPGLHFNVSGLFEAGTHNSDGTIDPGEKVGIELTIRNDLGVDVAPGQLASISAVVSGPTTNLNIVLNTSIPVAALTGTSPHTIRLPEPRPLEFAGTSTAALETFTTSRSPHWTGTTTTVFARTATAGGASTLASASALLANFADLDSTAGFARNEYVVVDDGSGSEEYVQVAWVDGSRLWFNQALRFAHAATATVQEVTLTTKTANTHYTLNAAAGTITELQEFGDGAEVVVTYTSDFVMPSVYPPAINDSPDLGEDWGQWTGKPIADGTYTLSIWGYRNLPLALYGETQTYRGLSATIPKDFLVGSADTLVPYSVISSGQNCNSCHNDLWFHGAGRRGFETCIACHGTAGSEDRARYTAANAPATTGLSINFRTMLHKIHMGKDLANASTYGVVGFGSGAYPNNFSVISYAEVGFPTMPDGTKQCTKCHGEGNETWVSPAARNHPTAQGLPVRGWNATCGSCHDSDAAQAHIELQTSSSGVEACAVCHGPGKDFHVEGAHKTR